MSEASASHYEQGLRQALTDGLPTRYTLSEGEPLGRGGFGIVYEAHDNLQGDQAAVKVFNRPEMAEMRTGFLEEAKRLHTMQHNHIIGVRWTGLIDSQYLGSNGWPALDRNVPYLIMDKADGSVERELNAGRINTYAAVRYLEQAMQGVAYAHKDHDPSSKDKIVHRDLKPANLLLQDGKVKVADFGAADTSRSRIIDSNPKSGLLVGTPPYMAPEQFRGNVQRSVDIYAMGAVGYYMIDGRMPIHVPFDDAYAWYNAHQNQVVAPMSTYGKSTKEARLIGVLREVFDTALAKEPADRFATMSEFRAAMLEAKAEADKLNWRGPLFTVIMSMRPPSPDTPTVPVHPDSPKPGTKLLPPYHPGRDASDAPMLPAPSTTVPPVPPRKPAHSQPGLTVDQLDERSTSPSNSNIRRRTLLTVLAAGVVGAAVWGVPKLIELGEAPPPIDTASPEQAFVDKIAKNILELLVDSNKKVAGPVLRELIQFNPSWSMEQADEIGLPYDGVEEFNRRLFVDNPEGAMQTFLRLHQERSDWSAVQLMAAIGSGYTAMNRPGTTKAETDRALAHKKLGKPEDNIQFSLMLQTLQQEGADYDNWRYLLSAALYPREPFDINRMNGTREESHTGNVVTADQVAEKLYNEGDLSGYETLGAVLAAERPDLSAGALKRLVTYAIGARNEQSLNFVATLSDAMAPYAPDIVAEQIAVMAAADGDASMTDTTNRMAISIAPFNPDATAQYITANIERPGTHLTAVALGHTLPEFVTSLKAKTPGEHRIWMDVAVKPADGGLADQALSELEDNEPLLSRSGATIGSGLVAGRRFANRES